VIQNIGENNMKLWKYSGLFLVATGILHTIAAVLLFANVYGEIIKDGLFNAVKEDAMRGCGFWFFICGIFLILFGYVVHEYIKSVQKPAPLFVGYSILLISIVGCIIEPVSGFWLFIPQALIIIFANRKIK
jgi:hypothetical protein